VKVVLLAGGYGTRISEETSVRPKPMVEVGGMPILWHIMKIYGAHGFRDFVVSAGYKSGVIKEFFADYFLNMSDVTFSLAENRVEAHESGVEPWRVTVADTGETTMTGGRMKRVAQYVGDEAFCMTYGDCVARVDIRALVEFHRSHGRIATVTAIQPPGRFGALRLGDDDAVASFQEKPDGDGAWVNGGFFVLEPAAFEYVDGDETIWEREPMERLAAEGELRAYRHTGYWQNLDTLRDKMVLEEQWASRQPPWKVWEA
jgi:glucose-1-phosphate cytidylyltransferase